MTRWFDQCRIKRRFAPGLPAVGTSSHDTFSRPLLLLAASPPVVSSIDDQFAVGRLRHLAFARFRSQRATDLPGLAMIITVEDVGVWRTPLLLGEPVVRRNDEPSLVFWTGSVGGFRARQVSEIPSLRLSQNMTRWSRDTSIARYTRFSKAEDR